MEGNKISCQTCGSISFTKIDKTVKCDYCGAEYDISQMQARAAKLEAEQKTLDSLADDISRLRQLADQKEAERQKAIEEEKRKQEKAAEIKTQQQQEIINNHKEAEKEAASCVTFLMIVFALLMIFISLAQALPG